MLEYGDREWEIEEITKRNAAGASIPIPDWWKQRQEVPDELRWFWQAFWELDTCRSYSEGVPHRIPWTAALEYARYHKIDFDYLWHLIVVLDGKYVEYRSEKQQKELDKAKKDAERGKQRGRKHGRR